MASCQVLASLHVPKRINASAKTEPGRYLPLLKTRKLSRPRTERPRPSRPQADGARASPDSAPRPCRVTWLGSSRLLPSWSVCWAGNASGSLAISSPCNGGCSFPSRRCCLCCIWREALSPIQTMASLNLHLPITLALHASQSPMQPLSAPPCIEASPFRTPSPKFLAD